MEAGPIYTLGKSFRARAEARQRQYRGEILKAGWSKYGHLLNEANCCPSQFLFCSPYRSRIELSPSTKIGYPFDFNRLTLQVIIQSRKYQPSESGNRLLFLNAAWMSIGLCPWKMPMRRSKGGE